MARQSNILVKEHQETEQFFNSGTALNRVLLEAPFYPRCSDNKTATLTRPRQYAIRLPYMQVNRTDMKSWLVFDLDHSNSLVWDDESLPAPNLIVRNRQSGHSHLYYAISSVCTSENARSKPIAFMNSIYKAFCLRLKADSNYSSGPVAKTPGHPWWSTTELHNNVYELRDLAAYVELEPSTRWSKGPRLDDISHSRHCIMFERLRFYAYSIVNSQRESGSFSSFVRQLEIYANDINSFKRFGFSQDLPLSSVRATVKSVSRWTWDKYRGCGSCNRGVMQLDADIPLVERQQLAATRTHSVRQSKTELTIKAVCRNLRLKGQPLTQVAIAVASKLTRQTVAKYKHIINEFNAPSDTAAKAKASTAPTNRCVKHAVNQVTAVLFGTFFEAGRNSPLKAYEYLHSFCTTTHISPDLYSCIKSKSIK